MCGQEKDISIIIESIMSAIAMVRIIVSDQDTLQFVDTLCIASNHCHITKTQNAVGPVSTAWCPAGHSRANPTRELCVSQRCHLTTQEMYMFRVFQGYKVLSKSL
jgi:hypothetical protein